MQIIVAILFLTGLVTIILAYKQWHWSLATIVLFIFLISFGYLFLAAETIRLHRNLRSNLGRLEEQLVSLQNQNEALLNGSGDELPGIAQFTHRLAMISRERGRAWRQVAPAGPLDDNGRREVTIPDPKPHGLTVDTVVYAFEAGNANPADPSSGQQYLGEFRVVESKETGVVLEPLNILDQRTGERLAQSQGPWNLYETMPVDRYSTFAGLDEAELRKRLAASVVEEYVRHGQEATAEDNPENVAAYDENGVRVALDQQGANKYYQRPLRDYGLLFSELSRQKTALIARVDAITEDNAKLAAALESAKKLTTFREEEKVLMQHDLAGMKRDRQAIESHLQQVKQQLENAQKLVGELLSVNSSLADELAERELSLREMIDAAAPAPATTISLP